MRKRYFRALPPGTIVHGRYRIEEVLGAGGFGVTYQVTDLQENQIAAMKEYMPKDIAVRDPRSTNVVAKPDKEALYIRFRDKFLEEAQVMYRFRMHPGIVAVQHCFYENNTAYYTMEYLQGPNLMRFLENRGGTLCWEELMPIMAQLVALLREIHQEGIVHRDISPDNIICLDDGEVKLIDFGAARSTIRTNSSVLLLKRGFSPPEQLSLQSKPGPWTDIYALAVNIYFAYTGQMPPDSSDRIRKDRIRWPSELGMKIPSKQWEDSLKKAMSLRIQDRYHDVETFWMELTGAPLQTPESFTLVGMRGYYEGTSVALCETFYLGRNPQKCQFLFPEGTPGVSYEHLQVWSDRSNAYVMDMGSTYGTWLGTQRLEPGKIYRMQKGDRLSLGSSYQMFYLM